MPNFHTKHLTPLSLPHEENGVSFLWEARSGEETLVLAQCETKTFFIKQLAKKDGFLVKGEKVTRPSQVKFLQKGLMAYESATGATPHFSNIHTQKNRHEGFSAHLKTPAFFAQATTQAREIWVEVGFGSGRHLLHQASTHPDVLHVGIEIHKPSIEQVIKQAEGLGLNNLYVVDYDARILMEFLPANSVGRIFVHFPIPWDKKPHRRVISAGFVEEALRVLKKEGTLELRTDSDAYYAYALEVFMRLSRVKLHVNKNTDVAVSSKYEDRWKRLEKNIYDITLVNSLESPPSPLPTSLEFKENISLENLRKKPIGEVIRGKDWFVHLEAWYEINKESAMIKVAFGACDRPEHRYVIIERGQARYFPEEIFSTKSNIAAHETLLKWMQT
jgi:tRNA (guanine-N7-)-methyltransferase